MIDLDNEQIVIEVRELVNNIESVKEEVDVYCSLIRQMFLAGSGKN